jgi:methyl-accepting chemotaxis protein
MVLDQTNGQSSQSAEDSKITRGLTTFVGFGLLLFGVSAWNLFDISQGFRTITQRNFRLEELSGKIVYLDEVLTMSARMAATTGDPQWEQRFQKYDPQLVAAIKEFTQIAPNTYKNISTEVSTASNKLVELDQKSFSLVRQGKKEEALKVLFGNEYQTQKKIYAEGSNKSLEVIRSETVRDLQSFNQRLIVSLVFTLLTIPAIVGAYLIIFRLIRSYLSDRDRAQTVEIQSKDELVQVQQNLLELNKELEAQAQSLSQQEREAQDSREFMQQRALELLMEVDPISRGDLTVRAKVTADEIGTIADSYNATVSSLRQIVTQVQDASQQVLTTTSDSGTSIQSLSTEALRQSQEVNDALADIARMSNSIAMVATTAQKAEAAVEEANTTVKAGEDAMSRTVDGFLAIRDTVTEATAKVQRLGESSEKISKVVNLIGTFAAQTNLLALNASMEAARAGEEGRGFAVVANEVRSLARQSAKATAEIEKMVAEIQSGTQEVVAAMATGAEQVATGTQLVDDARQSLTKIVLVSEQISGLVEAIAQATVTQSQASESVTETMNNVAAIAGKTSSEANQVSASFKQLLTLAQDLQASVEKFKVS